MKIDKLEYHFHTLSGGFELRVEANNEKSMGALYELHSIFFEVKNKRFVYDSEIHYVTMKMKEEVRLYTKKFEKYIPQINQLNSAISKMECGEGFALLSKKIDSTIDEIMVIDAVLSSNSFSIPDLGKLSSDDLCAFKKQAYNYRFFSPRVDLRILIGPARKKERKCRFCGETTYTGATFKKVAHAIPESLGNKNIICADECDTCNHFFGKTYEKSLVEYFNFFRVIDGVKSKEG
ncbi:HNH endonuclease, partial [Aeromonas jandaei]